VRKGWVGCYFEDRAYFKKQGLSKRIVLHEIYHHLAYTKDLDLPMRLEEKEANHFARRVLKFST